VDVEADRKPFAAVAEQSMSALIATSIPTARQLSMTNINDLVTATLPHHSSGNSGHREIFRNVPDTKIWLTNRAPAGFFAMGRPNRAADRSNDSC